MFLISVIDGYSRFIVHHELRVSMEEYDVQLVLERALEKFPDTWSPGYFVFKVLLVICLALLALQALAVAARFLAVLARKPSPGT